MPRLISLALALAFFVPFSSRGDGPKDNIPTAVRPIPPVGIEIAAEVAKELRDGAAELSARIESLRRSLAKRPELLELLPDVEIFAKAVDWAVRYRQIYRPSEIQVARELLKQGQARAEQLRQGHAPWLKQTGLVVRGYRSRIDGSVQPYGLVIPPGFVPGGAPHRLDFWFHGRGEKLSELSFIHQRQRVPGHFTPPDTIVLHPYGRYSCANKFAGETDLFEALEHARRYYPIDENRISVRGFSMGGAACWQFAVHYPGHWFAATPGAGFSETPEFLRVFQGEELKPAWYERKLWRLYDCTGYALNLYNLPTIAYSGEVDRQKQAADIMARSLRAEGMTLTHLIGPGMGHKYDEASKAEIERRMNLLAERGRDRLPPVVKFTTFTLRYNRSHWLRLDGIEQHWERARVEARLLPESNRLRATTRGVTALTFEIPSGRSPFAVDQVPVIEVDGTELKGAPVETDRSWKTHLRKVNGRWRTTPTDRPDGLAKRHGLQGPIDDAFMDSFLFVRPTGQSPNPRFHDWCLSELEHARKHWQLQFRGIARIKDDRDVTPEDIARHNLILWGDPRSNRLLARLADKLPIGWSARKITAGADSFDAAGHALIAIYPNPLNPDRYIVLNSGFTYREYAYLNNARQVPMLPDWAIVDLSTPPGTQYPGRIATAGFFGERWELTGRR